MSFFEALLGREYGYVCHNLRTEKKAFSVNSQDKFQEIGTEKIIMLEIKPQKHILKKIMTTF